MAKLTAREAAVLRMAMHDESLALGKDMMNTSPELGADYPKMLYRPTDVEDVHVVSTDKNGLPRETMVRNRFDGLLCDTTIANDVDEAEALAEDGWDISPHAAHGVVRGMVAATSAKDAEIAALRAQVEAMQNAGGHDIPQPLEAPRRGRPPKERVLTD